jgi:hypothetical protein
MGAAVRGIRAMIGEQAALEWHLKYNHFPSLPDACIGIARQAIDHLRECPDYAMTQSCTDTINIVDSGISHKIYDTDVPAVAICDEWHLWDFIDQ